ncbi:hypothetical protein BGP_2680 [Beggiatoa sp. PS]|nr:hypothetical protein BGP_2680 [Beggiatoa sp. PS]
MSTPSLQQRGKSNSKPKRGRNTSKARSQAVISEPSDLAKKSDNRSNPVRQRRRRKRPDSSNTEPPQAT